LISKRKSKKFSAGCERSLILDEKRNLYGHGEIFAKKKREILDENIKPVKIKCPKGNFFKMDSGFHHTLVSTTTGKLFSIGTNSHGELALKDFKDRYSFTEIELPEPFEHFWCTSFQSFVLMKSGNLYATGDNEYGTLGLGDNFDRNIFTKMNLISQAVPLFQIDGGYYQFFKLLYLGHKKNLKCIWRRVPVEIIKEICKFI